MVIGGVVIQGPKVTHVYISKLKVTLIGLTERIIKYLKKSINYIRNPICVTYSCNLKSW